MGVPEEEVGAPDAIPKVESIREYLSREEVEQALRRLTIAEKTALIKFARAQALKTKPYDAHDLLQETQKRCLEEDRRLWPKDITALAFLCGVVRSIASEWRNNPVPDPPPEPEPVGNEERRSIARIDAQRFIRLFEDDVIAQRIVIGIMIGTRGEELRESSGLNAVEYESRRKKIRRRIERYLLDTNT